MNVSCATSFTLSKMSMMHKLPLKFYYTHIHTHTTLICLNEWILDSIISPHRIKYCCVHICIASYATEPETYRWDFVCNITRVHILSRMKYYMTDLFSVADAWNEHTWCDCSLPFLRWPKDRSAAETMMFGWMCLGDAEKSSILQSYASVLLIRSTAFSSSNAFTLSMRRRTDFGGKVNKSHFKKFEKKTTTNKHSTTATLSSVVVQRPADIVESACVCVFFCQRFPQIVVSRSYGWPTHILSSNRLAQHIAMQISVKLYLTIKLFIFCQIKTNNAMRRERVGCWSARCGSSSLVFWANIVVVVVVIYCFNGCCHFLRFIWHTFRRAEKKSTRDFHLAYDIFLCRMCLL